MCKRVTYALKKKSNLLFLSTTTHSMCSKRETIGRVFNIPRGPDKARGTPGTPLVPALAAAVSTVSRTPLAVVGPGEREIGETRWAADGRVERAQPRRGGCRCPSPKTSRRRHGARNECGKKIQKTIVFRTPTSPKAYPRSPGHAVESEEPKVLCAAVLSPNNGPETRWSVRQSSGNRVGRRERACAPWS